MLCSILFLAEQQAGAANTSLFLSDNSAAEILSLTKETEGSVGKYLEEMLESQKDFKQKKIITAGGLANQWHNQDELLLIPVLENKADRPVITAYGLEAQFQYRGRVSVQEAMQSFLCQSMLERFTWETGRGQAVELTDLKVTRKIAELEGKPQITVKISGKGKILTEGGRQPQEKLQLSQSVEKELQSALTRTAEHFKQEYHADLTNSFLSLGGQNRKLYQQYRDAPETYAEELSHVFEVDITILEWE